VRIWAGEGGGKREFKVHDGPITAFAITASGRRIVTAGADGSVKIWDAEKMTLQSEIKNAHAGGVTAIALPPDGPRLFTVGADKKVKVWKILDGSPIATLDAPTSDGPAPDRLLFVRLDAPAMP
jgi:WD40 repeat protein